MSWFSNIDNLSSVSAGIVLIGLLVIGSLPNDNSRSTLPASSVNSNEHTNSITSGYAGTNLGTITLEDLGIQDDWETQQIYKAEDDYWEIETFDGRYYRIRREDADKDFYGHDEFDIEELIGGPKDLFEYTKYHQIHPW